MPTERFRRLKEEKKTAVSSAVLSEFQESSYGEVRVSRIAGRARVSRESLYTYFLDKEDMLLYALHQTWLSLLECNKDNLLKNGGDFWSVMALSFRYQMKLCKTNQIYRLIYLKKELLKCSCGGTFSKWKERDFQNYKDWMYEHMEKGNLRSPSKEEADAMQESCQALIAVSVLESMFDINGEDEIERSFKQQLLRIKDNYCILRKE